MDMQVNTVIRWANARSALWSGGFRPFFLAAGAFAAVAVPLWVLALDSGLAIVGAGDPLHWHIHEMIFGYVGAVVAGFLMTAIPNWTGRLPVRGRPLMLLAFPVAPCSQAMPIFLMTGPLTMTIICVVPVVDRAPRQLASVTMNP